VNKEKERVLRILELQKHGICKFQCSECLFHEENALQVDNCNVFGDLEKTSPSKLFFPTEAEIRENKMMATKTIREML